MFTQPEAVHQPAQPVLSIRTRTTEKQLPELIGPSYGAIATYLAELGEAPAGMPFVAYYNMDMQDLDLEIGFPVARELPGKDAIQPGWIAEGTVAATLYTGRYEGLAEPYQALGEWVQQQGYEAVGVSYEYYLNSPMEVPFEELQTRLVFPLKEK